MISLEQIRTLESKVHKTVELLSSMQEENNLLRGKLTAYEKRIEELEFLIEEFKEEQSEIEQGIVSALRHLDSLESAVGGLKPSSPEPEPNTSAPAPSESPVQPTQSWQAAEEATVVEEEDWTESQEAAAKPAGQPDDSVKYDEEQEESDTRQLDIF